MLKNPYLDIPYSPDLMTFVGRLDIYDREDTLGEELWSLDPNDAEDRDVIIRKYILRRIGRYTYRHKYLLVEKLKECIEDSRYDFSQYFLHDPEEYNSLAWDETEIDTPRSFMERVYEIAKEEWKGDLEKASLEDQSTW
ncbi:hypothetical protein C4K68_19545 [Pokkaliibacter plantistimulans]|uniref:Uncharacterized protein n=1 Tax=Proteobacteria bacterium 228 TaxID=2083153 RepID=A0A2S5KM39_9PROT|nr:hypothetical protein [Pokkaliibacter plantistimulans]PPC75599.1 hypothetical protein C4K68_19545 [Pokkaliibacter plantistimulans]